MARTVVLGQAGTGKSWKAGKYLEEVVPAFTHAVHFDIEDEEAGLCVDVEDGPGPVFGTLYVDRPAYDGEYDLSETIWTNRKLRIVPDGLTKEETVDLFGQVCAVAMSISGLEQCDFHLSCDEAHNVAPNVGLDERVSRAVTGGRKRGLEWMFATQRPQNINEDVLSQSNWGIYFKMTGDRDLGKANDSTESFDATRRLPQLEPRECIVEDKFKGRHWTVSTNSETRQHPHMADDDGKADDYLEAHAEGAPGDDDEADPVEG